MTFFEFIAAFMEPKRFTATIWTRLTTNLKLDLKSYQLYLLTPLNKSTSNIYIPYS